MWHRLLPLLYWVPGVTIVFLFLLTSHELKTNDKFEDLLLKQRFRRVNVVVASLVKDSPRNWLFCCGGVGNEEWRTRDENEALTRRNAIFLVCALSQLRRLFGRSPDKTANYTGWMKYFLSIIFLFLVLEFWTPASVILIAKHVGTQPSMNRIEHQRALAQNILLLVLWGNQPSHATKLRCCFALSGTSIFLSRHWFWKPFKGLWQNHFSLLCFASS